VAVFVTGHILLDTNVFIAEHLPGLVIVEPTEWRAPRPLGVLEHAPPEP